MPNTAYFMTDAVYSNVYLIFIDASGHSSIVQSNPQDKADMAFDLLQHRVADRLDALCQRYRCGYAETWSWQGDGGLLVVHDNDESVARDVALEFAHALLQLDLRHLQDEFRQQELDGSLHLRIAVHKGTIKYPGDDRRGSIHSPDINFTAHLEEATPSDALAISDDVYRVCGKYAADFSYCGAYDGHRVYLWAAESETRNAAKAWLIHQGLARATELFAFYERPSQSEKARIISLAEQDMIDMGSTLRTCSNYLVTTERPAYYRDAVLDLLERGGRYRCYLVDPDSQDARHVEERTHEPISKKVQDSLTRFTKFKQKHGSIADNLEVYKTSYYPSMAAMAADLHTRNGILLYTPYIVLPPELEQLEKGDTPHYLASATANTELYESLRQVINNLISDQAVTRVI